MPLLPDPIAHRCPTCLASAESWCTDARSPGCGREITYLHPSRHDVAGAWVLAHPPALIHLDVGYRPACGGDGATTSLRGEVSCPACVALLAPRPDRCRSCGQTIPVRW